MYTIENLKFHWNIIIVVYLHNKIYILISSPKKTTVKVMSTFQHVAQRSGFLNTPLGAIIATDTRGTLQHNILPPVRVMPPKPVRRQLPQKIQQQNCDLMGLSGDSASKGAKLISRRKNPRTSLPQQNVRAHTASCECLRALTIITHVSKKLRLVSERTKADDHSLLRVQAHIINIVIIFTCTRRAHTIIIVKIVFTRLIEGAENNGRAHTAAIIISLSKVRTLRVSVF